MTDRRRPIELLAPARDLTTAVAAISHGADAVYIGASAYGARASAANAVDDIRRLVEYAHQFRVRVYVTVNTIIYDRELRDVERLIRDLYAAGADALIVQDMAILRLDIPPIELHASTQCDIRTPQKARFLQDVGFSQIVLARELTLAEISDICGAVTIPVETFVHGALCVSYSGRCHAGQALMGRSANRGQCPQICRMPFDLVDPSGHAVVRNRHLLSMRDLNASVRLPELIAAGASSFKIEGRLKDAAYVKNITAHYRHLLDNIIDTHPQLYRRTSCGREDISFNPQPEKAFNRGFTSLFINSRQPAGKLATVGTPKSLGEVLKPGQLPSNGDGISFFDPADGTYKGVRVNKVEGSRIVTAGSQRIPSGVTLHRTFDNTWQKLMARDDTSCRTLAVDIRLYTNRAEASDERGCSVTLRYDAELQQARNPFDARRVFAKTGGTIYRLRSFESHLPDGCYIPPSVFTDLRRRLLKALDEANTTAYRFSYRRKEDVTAVYPGKQLDYTENVANHVARRFYIDHGAKQIEAAMETERVGKPSENTPRLVMTCRYCILRQLDKCLKVSDEMRRKLPLRLRLSDGRCLRLNFDCRHCEMQVFTDF